MREPLSSLRRADAIALPQELDEHARHGLELEVSGNPDGAAEVAAFPQFIWSTRRNIHVNDAPAAPVVFCGIARPQQFFAQLRAAGIAPAAEIAFRDHHPYKREDIERLRTARKKFGATGFLTTDKDAVNLGNLRAQLQPFVVAELEMTLEDPAGVLDAILTGITRIKPRS
jgi:tetraacyldisaccharide 4'-kinase